MQNDEPIFQEPVDNIEYWISSLHALRISMAEAGEISEHRNLCFAERLKECDYWLDRLKDKINPKADE